MLEEIELVDILNTLAWRNSHFGQDTSTESIAVLNVTETLTNAVYGLLSRSWDDAFYNAGSV